MIKSTLGEVILTQPNYELCDVLSCTKEDVDMSVEAILGADLTSILGALSDIYGAGHAMEMWTRSAELFRETLIGE